MISVLTSSCEEVAILTICSVEGRVTMLTLSFLLGGMSAFISAASLNSYALCSEFFLNFSKFWGFACSGQYSMISTVLSNAIQKVMVQQ